MDVNGYIDGLMDAYSYIHQELMVRLTDESDPFFLFTLTINEDDFQQ